MINLIADALLIAVGGYNPQPRARRADKAAKA
jgi:hypothetical protein